MWGKMHWVSWKMFALEKIRLLYTNEHGKILATTLLILVGELLIEEKENGSTKLNAWHNVCYVLLDDNDCAD